jgi:secreted pullulanase
MLRKFNRKIVSYLLSIVMILNIFIPLLLPLQTLAQEIEVEKNVEISVDGDKDDWAGINPINTTVDNFEDELLGNLYLQNDEESLFFWVDAQNIDNWGEKGQYINIAFQVNEENSENSGNPWNSMFDYSGTTNKPQYHLSFRIQGNDEVNNVALYETLNNDFTELLDTWDDTEGAEFSVNRTIGFEGKLPLDTMNLENGDELQAHVTLSGNENQHGAFDVIPKMENNARAFVAEGVSETDVQSVYTEPYTIEFIETEVETLEEIDTTKLTELISTAESYSNESGDYTEESFTALTEATENAENVLLTIETEEALAQAVASLEAAINGLVESGMTEELEAPIETVEDEIPDGFFRIHFESLPSNDLNDLGLWIWDDVAEPSDNWPAGALSFIEATETDYGYFMDFEMAEYPEQLGLLINSRQGNGQTEDMEFDLLSPEMNEAWITSDWELYPYEPLVDENILRVNYLREDADYEDIGLWTWEDVLEPTTEWPNGAHTFDSVGKYGNYVDLDLETEPSNIGFLLLDKATEAQTGDMEFSDFSHTQVFLREGDETVYTNPYYANELNMDGAEIVSETELEIRFESTEGLTEENLRELLTITDVNGNEINLANYSITIDHENSVVILEGPFDLETGGYTVHFDEKTQTPARMGWRLKDELYAYDGKLGLDLRQDGTATLKLWSPSAKNVNVILYDKADQDVVVHEGIEMSTGAPGVWEVELNEETTGLVDVTGYYYHFEIEREDETVLALDPYAKSMAAWDNSDPDNYVGKAAIVNPSMIGPELNYANIDGFEKREDAIIYEIHVRDFTSDPEISNELESQFGTFSAFVEKLDYIEDLGVTHIQLLPVMSYFFADEFNNDQANYDYESTGTNYNWGYDPQSYFSLTGMYSENPEDPAKRIEEFKNLIDEIHSRGMGIILDVVYNHTASLHIFEDLEPNYYHFMDADGTPRTSFGGGRLGTTHEMARRILVDSIMYWVEEYKVDGFRFDMMGDHDAETIQIAYNEAAKLNPNILMIGEGWVTYAGDEGDDIMPADQQWMQYTDGVASFSDDMRNELKSGFGSEGEPRFLTGGARSIQRIYDNLTATPHNFTADDPGDVVPYIAAHDNLTLHDVIAQSIQKDPEYHQEEIHDRIRLGNLMVLTAQGTPFIHAGQEYGRTKQFRHPNYDGPVAEAPYKSTYMTDENGEPFEYPYFIHDSYDSSDMINHFDWAAATDSEDYPIHTNTRAYTKGLIELRRSTDAFSKGTMSEVDEMITLVDIPEVAGEDLAIVYRAEDSNGDIYYVLVNADNRERTFTMDVDLTAGDVLVDGATAGTIAITDPTGVSIETDRVTMKPLTASVIRLTDEPDVVVEEKTRTETVDFETEIVETTDLPEGEENILTEGVVGERTIIEAVTYTNGEETGRKVISDEVTTKPVNQVVEVGITTGDAVDSGDEESDDLESSGDPEDSEDSNNELEEPEKESTKETTNETTVEAKEENESEQAKNKNNLPKTGETNSFSIYFLGFILITGGLMLVVKLRKDVKEE